MRYVLQNHFRDNSSFFSGREKRDIWNGVDQIDTNVISLIESRQTVNDRSVFGDLDQYSNTLPNDIPRQGNAPEWNNTVRGSHEMFFDAELGEILESQIERERLSKQQKESMYAWVAKVCERGSKEDFNSQNPTNTIYTKSNFEKGFTLMYKNGGNVTHSGLNTLFKADRKTKEGLKKDFQGGVKVSESKLKNLIGMQKTDIAKALDVFDNGTKELTGITDWHRTNSKWKSGEKEKMQYLQETLLQIQQNEGTISPEKAQQALIFLEEIRLKNKTAWSSQLSTSAQDFLGRTESILHRSLQQYHYAEQIQILSSLSGSTTRSVSFNQEYRSRQDSMASSLAGFLDGYNINIREFSEFTPQFEGLSSENKIRVTPKAVEYFSLQLKRDIYTLTAAFNTQNFEGKNIPKEIEALEIKIKGMKEWMQKLKSAFPITSNIKAQIEGLEVMIDFTEDQISTVRNYQSNYEQIDSNMMSYNAVYDSEGKLNIDRVLHYASAAHREIDSTIFSNGITPPNEEGGKVRSFLVSLAFDHGIDKMHLQQMLQGMNYHDTHANKPNNYVRIGKFYSEISRILNEKDPNKKQVFLQSFQEQHGAYISRTLPSGNDSIFWNALINYRNEVGKKVPKNPKEKIEQNSREIFFRNYQLDPNLAYHKYQIFYAKLSPEQKSHINLNEQWVTGSGEISSPTLLMLQAVIPENTLRQVQQSGKTAELVRDLQGYFKERQQNIPENEKSAENFLHSLNSSAVGDAVDNLIDYASNGELHGTGTAFLIGALVLFTKRGRKYIGMPLAAVATLYAVNDLAEGATDFNMMDEMLKYAIGSEAANQNPASWHITNESEELFAKHEISKKHAEIAGTALGKAPPAEVVEWYDRVKSLPEGHRTFTGKANEKCANGNEEITLAYSNLNKYCPEMKNILSKISPNPNDPREAEQYRAQAMFYYLESFFTQVSEQHKENPEDTPTSDKGRDHIYNTYILKTPSVSDEVDSYEGKALEYMKNREGARGFLFEEIYKIEMLTEAAEDRKTGASELFKDVESAYGVSSSLVSEKFREWGLDPLREGKDLFNTLEKFGFDVWEGAKHELMFGDKTAAAWGWVMEKYDGSWAIFKLPWQLGGGAINLAKDDIAPFIAAMATTGYKDFTNWIKAEMKGDDTKIFEGAGNASDRQAKLKSIFAGKEAELEKIYGINNADILFDALTNDASKDAIFKAVNESRKGIISQGIHRINNGPNSTPSTVNSWDDITHDEMLDLMYGGGIASLASYLGNVRDVSNAATGWSFGDLLNWGSAEQATQFENTGRIPAWRQENVVLEIMKARGIWSRYRIMQHAKDKGFFRQRVSALNALDISVSEANLEEGFWKKLEGGSITIGGEADIENVVKTLVTEEVKESGKNTLENFKTKSSRLVSRISEVKTNLTNIYYQPTPGAGGLRPPRAAGTITPAEKDRSRVMHATASTAKIELDQIRVKANEINTIINASGSDAMITTIVGGIRGDVITGGNHFNDVGSNLGINTLKSRIRTN